MAAPNFPGQVLQAGSTDKTSVLAIQRRLNTVGCGPVSEDGNFGPQTMEAIEHFQTRSVDHFGRPLEPDGRVGPMTWAALFSVELPPPVTAAASPLLTQTLTVAVPEIGVMEAPPGSNRGPRVDQYLTCVGLSPAQGSFAWCAAFVYFCFDQAAKNLTIPNPVIKTAGVVDHWQLAGKRGVHRISADECSQQPSLVQPGMIFILITSDGAHGHTGLVEQVQGTMLTTIEGNTNMGGSREGVGVFRRTTRKITDMRGFIDYGQPASA